MKKLLLTIMILSTALFAEGTIAKTGCILSQEGTVTVGWKAYKTVAKLGVGGVFDDVTYTAANKEGKNFKEILIGSSVLINTNSVNSKNEGRDKKLVASFFKLLGAETIDAKIIAIKQTSEKRERPRKGIITTTIMMNGISKEIPMNYTYNKGFMEAEGFIDLFDFQASKALASINKACFDLHKGKTWNDVAINFSLNIKADLCNIEIKR